MNAYVVDRKALEQNIQVLREKAGDTPIYGVIKGNGYGLGLIPMAQVLGRMGLTDLRSPAWRRSVPCGRAALRRKKSS